MAKTDNLTDFLTGVANAIRTKKGTTAKINPQNFEIEIGSITVSKPEQEKTAALSMLSGDQIVSPDSGKVLSKVTIMKPASLIPENIRKDMDIGGVIGTLEMKPEQEKTAALSMLSGDQIVSPDSGKVLSKVTIMKPASLIPENIRKDMDIGGVIGTLEMKPEQEKTDALLMLNGDQIISPDSGKVLSKVTITKPTALIPENIRKSTEIGGVVGTLEEAKPEQEKPITITTNGSQTVTPDEGKVLSKVTITTNVPATPTEEKTVELALANGNQVLTPTAGKNFSKVTITKPVTLTPENIRKNTDIGGVVGILEEAKPEQEKTAEATNSKQIISPDNGKTLSSVIIEAAPLPSIGHPGYTNINGCLINIENDNLILGCNDSIIPSNVRITSIGDYAFWGCSGLTNVTIPDGVTSIGNSVFSECSGLTNVTIPDGVTSIGRRAFSGCSGLTSVTIPGSVISIGELAFSYCSELTSVTIPDGVTSIEQGVFLGCRGLTDIIIPNGVTSIGDSAFSDCRGLTDIIIPNGVTSIGYSAFRQCSELTSITIGGNITSIKSNTFDSCIKLTNIVIPNSVTSIGNYAFFYCKGLTSITIPDGVTSIGEGAFSGCSGLTSVTIPDGVTSIGDRAFNECSGLTSVIIGNSVTTIVSSAFSNCSGLTSITIPDSVTNIGSSAFWGCSELTSVIWNAENCTSAGSSRYPIFGNCLKLANVTIGENVKIIPNYVFSGCSGLTNVIMLPTTPPTLGSDAFPSNVTTITVPVGCGEIYKTASGWSAYADKIVEATA